MRWKPVAEKAEYRARLENRMWEIQEEKGAIMDAAFSQNRLMTDAEMERCDELHGRYCQYAEMLARFFQPDRPPEPKRKEELLY